MAWTRLGIKSGVIKDTYGGRIAWTYVWIGHGGDRKGLLPAFWLEHLRGQLCHLLKWGKVGVKRWRAVIRSSAFSVCLVRRTQEPLGRRQLAVGIWAGNSNVRAVDV